MGTDGQSHDAFRLRRDLVAAGCRVFRGPKRLRADYFTSLCQASGRAGFFPGESPGEAGRHAGSSRPGHFSQFLGQLVTRMPEGGALLRKVLYAISIKRFDFLPHLDQRDPGNHPEVHGEGIPALPGSPRQGRGSGKTIRSLGASDQLPDQPAGDGMLPGNGCIGLDRFESDEYHRSAA